MQRQHYRSRRAEYTENKWIFNIFIKNELWLPSLIRRGGGIKKWIFPREFRWFWSSNMVTKKGLIRHDVDTWNPEMWIFLKSWYDFFKTHTHKKPKMCVLLAFCYDFDARRHPKWRSKGRFWWFSIILSKFCRFLNSEKCKIMALA